MRIHRLTMIGVVCLGSAALGQQNQDALKERVLAQAQSLTEEDYAFTRTVRTEGTQNGKKEETVSVEKFDPTKPANARWTLVSVDGAAPTADALNRFRKETAKRRVPGYYRLANYLGSPATSSTDSRGRTLFRFPSLPKGSVIVFDSDVSQKATAEVTVTESNGVPFAEQVTMTMPPTRLKLVMKLNNYESISRYRLGPEGKPLLIEQSASLAGSGMGQTGEMRTVVTYSEYRAMRGAR